MSGVVEEFDDDTDFALPTVPATAPAGNDAQMAQMQELMSRMQAGEGSGMMGGPPGPARIDDELSAEAKKWITVYPIYFDAKRKYMKGCRRVAYGNSSMWPKSDNIERAVAKLTLMHAHEPQKTHPQDWENPGRVKVQLFGKDGSPKNKKIESKKALLNAIAALIQPQCGGKPPALKKKKKSKPAPKVDSKETPKAAPSSATSPAAVNNKNAASKKSQASKRVSTKIQPGDRLKGSKPPSVSARLPIHSPAREAGLLNADLGGMMGGLQGMGPLGAMMGQMGLGGDDDDEEAAAEEEKKREEEEKNKKKDPMQQLGRRQRKRVVRIGR